MKGLHCGGAIGYGYYTEKKKIYVNEEEAVIVKEIFNRYAAGETGKQMQDDFAKRGILFKGKPFLACTIYNILHNEKYSGRYEIHGEVYTDIYPQIITPEIYQTCKEKIDANRYGKHVPDVSYLLRRKVFCGQCGTRMTSYTGTNRNGRVSRYYKCWNAIGKRNCQAKFIKKDVLDNLVINALQETLTGKNLSVIVDEIYKQHNAKLFGDNPVKRLEKDLIQTNKALSNLMKAIEQGIITDTTKERLQELETTKKELQEQLIMARMQEQTPIDKKVIEAYLKNGVKQEPQMMIDLLVNKVYVYSDHIELILNYTDEPIKPKPRIDKTDTDSDEKNELTENPDGTQSHRGFVIYEGLIPVNEYTFKGLQKNDLKPKLKETLKMPVFMEILI